MADEHIFVSSELACGFCTALNGATVPAGFKAHENCTCFTRPDGGDPECQHAAENIDFQRLPSGDIIASFEVTVICPNGESVGASGSVTSDPDTGNPIKDLWDTVRELADEICEDCPQGEEEPFRCC